MPTDRNVSLREISGRKMAVLKFSGSWSAERFETKKGELLRLVEQNGLRPKGEAMYARYNPPWTLWWLRRNEVQVEVD